MVRWNVFKKPHHNDEKTTTVQEKEDKISEESQQDDKTDEKTQKEYNETLYSLDHPQKKKPKKQPSPRYRKVEYIDIGKIEHSIDDINKERHPTKTSSDDAAHTGDLERRIDYILDKKKHAK